MHRFVETRRDGAVEYLTLNRPDVRNAFNQKLIHELRQWADAVSADKAVRVVVLAGAGSAFCAGADLAWMAEMASYPQADNEADARAAAQMYAALDGLPVPVIGRIHGAALGGGAGLVALCDVAVAEEHTTFGFTEVKVGIVPAIVSPYVLAKIGTSAARQLFLTGIRFDAVRAKEIGLVHEIVTASDLDTRVTEYVEEVLGAGPEAVAVAKRLLKEIQGRSAQDVMELTTATIAARRSSAEGQEGLRAFLEKRKVTWNISR